MIRRRRSTPQPSSVPVQEGISDDYRLGLDPDNWLSLTDDDAIAPASENPIIKLGAFLQSVKNWASTVGGVWPIPNRAWFTEQGIACQILRTKGGGWQKGRIRFRLEFLPDDPEAFMDDPGSDNHADQ